MLYQTVLEALNFMGELQSSKIVYTYFLDYLTKIGGFFKRSLVTRVEITTIVVSEPILFIYHPGEKHYRKICKKIVSGYN
jgi:hypothetical protein